MKQSLLTFQNWHFKDVKALVERALMMKQMPEDFTRALHRKSVVALFEKPSLRTRVSFDIGIHKLGGQLVYLDYRKDNLLAREALNDMAANLSCWADAIVARVNSHETLEQLSKHAGVPVINALCDRFHPCQALADFITLKEVGGELTQQTLGYIGDGNNVAHSLMILASHLGVSMKVVTPRGYEPDAEVIKWCQQNALESGTALTVSSNTEDLAGCDFLYTDTWVSMGDCTPLEQIKEVFLPYQLNEKLVQQCETKYVMHCQPAHRGYEISGSLLDSEISLHLQQAENRMHGQNALLTQLIGHSLNQQLQGDTHA